MVFKMLNPDPKYRWSVMECLASPYFDEVRLKPLEKQSSQELELSIDKPDVYDYYYGRNIKFNAF